MFESKRSLAHAVLCLLVFVVTGSSCGGAPVAPPPLTDVVEVTARNPDSGVPAPGDPVFDAPVSYATASGGIPVPRPFARRKITAVWDEFYLGAALDLIENAEREIEIVQLEYAWGDAIRTVQSALVAAIKRGVKVRVTLDDEPKVSVRSLPHLIKLGIDAKLDGSKTKLHAKLIVADRRRVLLGSTNLSDNSIMNNHETNLLIDDPALAEACVHYVDAIREDPHSSAKIPAVPTVGATVYFDRGFESELMKLLDGAKRSIDLQMYGTRYYSRDRKSPSTMALVKLVEARKRGARVRVILEQSGSKWSEITTDFNRETARFLESGGVDVRFDSPDTISHAKLLIVDEEHATVGSMNWGFGGFRLYHEVNSVVADQETVGDLAGYFAALWAEAEKKAQ